MPYRHLIKLAQGGSTDAEMSSFKLKISSSLESVRPEQIELLLDTKDFPTHLLVDDQGIFEVPYTKELFEENPMMVANQPRGTLNLALSLEVPPFNPPKVKDGQIKYKDLFEPLLELQNHVRKLDPTFGLMGKSQFALKIITDEPIRIHREMGTGAKSVKGSRTFRPINGIVYLFLEAYMFKDDPVVEIPGKVQIEIKSFPPDVVEKIKADY